MRARSRLAVLAAADLRPQASQTARRRIRPRTDHPESPRAPPYAAALRAIPASSAPASLVPQDPETGRPIESIVASRTWPPPRPAAGPASAMRRNRSPPTPPHRRTCPGDQTRRDPAAPGGVPGPRGPTTAFAPSSLRVDQRPEVPGPHRGVYRSPAFVRLGRGGRGGRDGRAVPSRGRDARSADGGCC